MKFILGPSVHVSASAFGAVVTLFLATAEFRTDTGTMSAYEAQRGQVRLADHERRYIVDPRLPPYSAVGRFRGTMTCTAAIALHPRIIITAGHCVTERDGTTRRSNFVFRQGYQAGSDLGRFAATVWAIGSKQSFERQSVHDASEDWAILILDRAPEGVRPFLLNRASPQELKSLQRQILMPGYSNDIADAEKISVDPACSVRKVAWHVLIHDCQALFGSSGAPLLVRDRTQYAIVGIHTGSMFASDEQGHVAKFVGNRAISSRIFAEALMALSQSFMGSTVEAEVARDPAGWWNQDAGSAKGWLPPRRYAPGTGALGSLF